MDGHQNVPNGVASAYHPVMAHDASHPLDTLWQAPAIVWSILAGECLALVLALSPATGGSRLVVFGLASFLIQWVILLTLGSMYGMRGPIGRLRPLHVAWLGLLLLLGWTWMAVAVARGLVGPALLGADGGDGWLSPMLRMTGIVLAVGVLGLAAFHNHWRARQSAVRTKQAELESLQARTHPHFLFNTLNTAVSLLHARPSEAERVLLDLSELFRVALAGPREIALAEELDLVRRYLDIEQLRLGRRMDVSWELPSSLPETQVPALSIQPLAENAVRHGIEHLVEGGRIEILVTIADDWMHATVRNDCSDPPRAGARQGHGVGLPSVAGRIEALTSGRGSLVTSAANGRYVATIAIPLNPQVTTS